MGWTDDMLQPAFHRVRQTLAIWGPELDVVDKMDGWMDGHMDVEPQTRKKHTASMNIEGKWLREMN